MNINFFNLTTTLVGQLKKFNLFLSEEDIVKNIYSNKVSFLLYDKNCNPVNKKVTVLDNKSLRYEILDIKEQYDSCDRVAYL